MSRSGVPQNDDIAYLTSVGNEKLNSLTTVSTCSFVFQSFFVLPLTMKIEINFVTLFADHNPISWVLTSELSVPRFFFLYWQMLVKKSAAVIQKVCKIKNGKANLAGIISSIKHLLK